MPKTATDWGQWQISPIAGGANNRVYRASSEDHDLAIKFTIAGERDRAGREYAALTALRTAGLFVAPEAILLDRTTWSQPAVVQTWVAGKVDDLPPQSDAEWTELVNHLLKVHSVAPEAVDLSIPGAVQSAYTAHDAVQLIEDQVRRIPSPFRSDDIHRLLMLIMNSAYPEWPTPSQSLVRGDPAIRNFIKRQDSWLSIDWENSGWGDPAYEIADMMTHPNYANIDETRWEWVISSYCDGRSDPNCESRIHTYYHLGLAWWVARLERTLYETPLGLDQRLVERRSDWKETTEKLRDEYLRRYCAMME